MSGLRNRAWSRENVTINQRWAPKRAPDALFQVYQCHHADECIELMADGNTEGTHDLLIVGVGELRKQWMRVS